MMATHEMQFCREIADQVCFLDAGRILERGSADEVFGAPEGAAHEGVPEPGARLTRLAPLPVLDSARMGPPPAAPPAG